jgi:hypothetical protein
MHVRAMGVCKSGPCLYRMKQMIIRMVMWTRETLGCLSCIIAAAQWPGVSVVSSWGKSCLFIMAVVQDSLVMGPL